MTPPTVPPVTCPIELDPLAPPCGSGLEGWGGPMPAPVVICRDGQTVEAIYWGEYEAASAGRDGNSLGACAQPVPAGEVPVAPPESLPVTGAAEVVQVGLASALLLAGVALVRFARH